MKTIKLPVFDIEITLADDNSSGAIKSNFKEGEVSPEENYYFKEYDAAVDGVELFILAAACEGIDVTSTAFVEAIKTAADAIANRYG